MTAAAGCTDHVTDPQLHCHPCRTGGWGWLRAAVKLAKAEAAAERAAPGPAYPDTRLGAQHIDATDTS